MSGGRIFYILDEVLTGIVDERLPEVWSLVARDAFSGGLRWAVSPDDGKRLGEIKMDSLVLRSEAPLRRVVPPVFDGIIAAGGRLYISTRDGRVACMGKGE